jgi:hypothetical protein
MLAVVSYSALSPFLRWRVPLSWRAYTLLSFFMTMASQSQYVWHLNPDAASES